MQGLLGGGELEDQDVGALQVVVHDALPVEVLQTQSNLRSCTHVQHIHVRTCVYIHTYTWNDLKVVFFKSQSSPVAHHSA